MEATVRDRGDEARAVGRAHAGQFGLYREVMTRQAARALSAPEDALARAAQAGDRAARDALYWRLEPRLQELAGPARRWARAAGGGRIEEADVQQQVYLVFVALLRDWQPARAPFAVYVRTLLPRCLTAYVRHTLRPRELSAADEPLAVWQGDDADTGPTPLAEPVPAAPDPLAGYLAQEFCAALLAGLDPRSRRLIVLHVLADQPMPAVARTLGVSLRTAWRLYRAALATLRAEVVDDRR